MPPFLAISTNSAWRFGLNGVGIIAVFFFCGSAFFSSPGFASWNAGAEEMAMSQAMPSIAHAINMLRFFISCSSREVMFYDIDLFVTPKISEVGGKCKEKIAEK